MKLSFGQKKGQTSSHLFFLTIGEWDIKEVLSRIFPVKDTMCIFPPGHCTSPPRGFSSCNLNGVLYHMRYRKDKTLSQASSQANVMSTRIFSCPSLWINTAGNVPLPMSNGPALPRGRPWDQGTMGFVVIANFTAAVEDLNRNLKPNLT